MEYLFDLDFVVTNFGACEIGYYFELIQKASTEDLRKFRAQVIADAKCYPPRYTKAFTNTPDFTPHDAILTVIDHELRKRSPLQYRFWSLLLPIRRFWIRHVKGMELEEIGIFGALRVTSESVKRLWHYSPAEFLSAIGRFIEKHEAIFVTAIVGLISAVILNWLAGAAP